MWIDKSQQIGLVLVVESGANIVISPETLSEKAERIISLREELARETEVAGYLIGYLRATGRGDWVPDNLVLLTQELNQSTSMPKPGAPRQEHGTWTGEIAAAIQGAENGATFAEIKAALAKGPIASKLESNPNGFYSGVMRLEKAGEAFRHNGRLFTRYHLDAYLARVKRGEIQDLAIRGSKRTVPDAVVEFVNGHPKGIAPNTIVLRMVEDGISPTDSAVYNVLSKLARKGRLHRSNGLYYPVNEMGRSQVTESSPDAGGVAAPSVENRGQLDLD